MDSSLDTPSSGVRSDTSAPTWLGPLLWVAVLGALGAFFSAMARIEPLTGDGWYNADEAKQGVSWDLIVSQLTYLHNNGNPRIGQAFTLLTYGSSTFHVIATPLVEVLLLVLVTAHALGRVPSPRSALDGLAVLVAAAGLFLAVPQPGHAFFYRPITTNYLYTLTLSLAFFLPQRLGLKVHGTLAAATWSVLLFGLGLGIGKTNEHTGPAMILVAAVFAALAFRQRAGRDLAWRAAATAGLLVGYLYLFFAPGQERRYGHLGRQSVLQTIVERGLLGTADLLGEFAGYVGPLLLGVIALGLLAVATKPGEDTLERVARARWTVITYVALAALVLGTTLAAPKNHYRLFIAPSVLLVIAATALLHALARERLPAIALGVTSAVAIAWTAAIFIPMYTAIHEDELARNAIVMSAGPDDVVVIPRTRYPKRNSYYYGDSLVADPRHRDRMAALYDVGEIKLLPKDSTAEGGIKGKVKDKDQGKVKSKIKPKSKSRPKPTFEPELGDEGEP